ncbi:hypothetical protein BH18THE2_BH18THE2_42020 [soil metagenome]
MDNVSITKVAHFSCNNLRRKWFTDVFAEKQSFRMKAWEMHPDEWSSKLFCYRKPGSSTDRSINDLYHIYIIFIQTKKVRYTNLPGFKLHVLYDCDPSAPLHS